jgi:tripartite ATP-independent transporter DctM subunit
MSAALIGLLGVLALLALVLARVPVAIALAAVGVVGYAAVDGWSSALAMFGTVPFELASAYSLSVVPLFILMGAVAAKANMSRELFDAANALFSGFRGALASATIGACAAFSSICGSSMATAATMSRVAIPEMRRHGYDAAIAAGTVASGGTLGILIPPSVILVIYAIVAEQSIAQLFAAALLPGLLLAALHVLVIVVIARMRPETMPRTAPMAARARLLAALRMWKLAVLFFLAVFGIYLGWFSPTEAAAVGAAAALVIAFASGQMGWAGFRDAVLETVFTSAMLFFVIIGAFVFSRFVVLTQLPGQLVGWVETLQLPGPAVLAALVAMYLVLGCFLESVSMILISVPVVLPVVTSLGYDGVWFGVFVTVLAEAGLITPPVGLNVFVIRSQLPELPLATIFRGAANFLVADVLLLVLLAVFPGLALWLPARLGL